MTARCPAMPCCDQLSHCSGSVKTLNSACSMAFGSRGSTSNPFWQLATMSRGPTRRACACGSSFAVAVGTVRAVRASFGMAMISLKHWSEREHSVDEIIAQNRHFRSSKAFAELYAPFTDLLFFGAEGNGDLFAYRVTDGRVADTSIYEWDHETDDRARFASDLKEYVGRTAASVEPPAPSRRSFASAIVAWLRGVFGR